MRFNLFSRGRSAAIFSILFSLPQAVWACSVCFGGAESGVQRGFFWGILILLLLPLVSFTLIGGKIFMSIRRKNRMGKMAP